MSDTPFRLACILMSTGLLFAGPEAARAAAPALVTVSKAEILLVPGAPAVGFFTVTNTSDATLLMTGWSAPACGTLRFEEADAGGAGAGRVPTVTVPAKNQLVFAPGGYHLTCRKPPAALRSGAVVPVTFAFRSGATLTAPFLVKEGSSRPGLDNHPG